MLQEELWILRLSEASHLQQETCLALNAALISQIEQRLLAGHSIYIPHLAEWRIIEHREFLAHTADGKYWLMPPHLSLGLVPETDRRETALSILLFGDLLAEITNVGLEHVQRWLTLIPSLLREQLQEGNSIVWSGLGEFRPELTAGQLTGFSYTPSASLIGALAKPFGMFSPVEIKEPTDFGDLFLRNTRTLEELDEVRPLHLSLTKEEKHEPEPLLESEEPLPATGEQVEQPSVSVEEPAPTPRETEKEFTEPSTEEEAEKTPSPSYPEAAEVAQPTTTEAAVYPAEQDEETSPHEGSDSEVTAAEKTEDTKPSFLLWCLISLGISIGFLFFIYLLSLQSQPEPKRAAMLDSPQRAVIQKDNRISSPDSAASVSLQEKLKDSLLHERKAADSMQAEKRQAVVTDLTTASQSSDKRLSRSSLPIVNSETSEADTPKVIKLRPGDRLTRLATQRYGHRAFWVYIYQENKSKLKDPDNIPVGATITLPAAEKYHIDAHNTNSVNRALSLQRRLLSR